MTALLVACDGETITAAIFKPSTPSAKAGPYRPAAPTPAARRTKR